MDCLAGPTYAYVIPGPYKCAGVGQIYVKWCRRRFEQGKSRHLNLGTPVYIHVKGHDTFSKGREPWQLNHALSYIGALGITQNLCIRCIILWWWYMPVPIDSCTTSWRGQWKFNGWDENPQPCETKSANLPTEQSDMGGMEVILTSWLVSLLLLFEGWMRKALLKQLAELRNAFWTWFVTTFHVPVLVWNKLSECTDELSFCNCIEFRRILSCNGFHGINMSNIASLVEWFRAVLLWYGDRFVFEINDTDG